MFGLNSIVYFYPKNGFLYYLSDTSGRVKKLEVKTKSNTPNIPFWATFDFFDDAKNLYKKARPYDSFIQRIFRKKTILIVYPPDVSTPERRFLRDFCEQMGAVEVYMSAENIGIFSKGRPQECFNISDTGRNYVLSILSKDFNQRNPVEIIEIFDKEKFNEEEAKRIISQSYPSKAGFLPVYYSGEKYLTFKSMNVRKVSPEAILENISLIINSIDKIKAARLKFNARNRSNFGVKPNKDQITRFKVQ